MITAYLITAIFIFLTLFFLAIKFPFDEWIFFLFIGAIIMLGFTEIMNNHYDSNWNPKEGKRDDRQRKINDTSDSC